MTIFNSIILETRANAEDVLDQMNNIIEVCGCATAKDLFDLVGLESDLSDTKRGWGNLDDATPIKVRDGYRLKLPDPIEILPSMVNECVIDMVSHPPHYQSDTGLEVIDVIKAFTSDLTGIEATDTGNIIKYICRWKHKNGVEDLKKAKWYLEHLIKEVE